MSQNQLQLFSISVICGDNVQALLHWLITNVLNNQSLLNDFKQKSSENNKQINGSSQVAVNRKKHKRTNNNS